MDPVSAIATACTAGSHAVDLLKGAAEQAKALGKAEIIGNLIEAQVALMQVLAEQQKLANENRELNDTVHALQQALRIKQALEHHHDAYWLKLEDVSLDGPFSTREWDTKQLLVRTPHFGTDAYGDGVKAHFHDQANKESVYVPVTILRAASFTRYTTGGF